MRACSRQTGRSHARGADLLDGVVEGGGRKLEDGAFGAPAGEDRGLIDLMVPVRLRGDGAAKAEEAKVWDVLEGVGEPEGLGVDVGVQGMVVVLVIVGMGVAFGGEIEVRWLMDKWVGVAGWRPGRTGEEGFVGMGRHWRGGTVGY